MLQLTEREFDKFKKIKKVLPATKVFSLAERLELGFETIATGKIDYQALTQHYFGNKNFLPERYTNAALGRRRTVLCILNYIESMFGWKERLLTLRHFQLNESIFANIDEPINFLFASDICEYLSRYKLDEAAFSQIGIHTFQTINSSKVKKELGETKNISELYEKMCLDFAPKHLEQNFIYDFHKTSATTCVYIAKPNPIMLDMLNLKTVGNPATSILRGSVAASFSTLFDLPPSSVKQISSIYQGDSDIKYEIDFSYPQYILKNKEKIGSGKIHSYH